MRDMTAPPPPMQPVFDGHNDLLARLFLAGDRTGQAFFDGTGGHIDLAKCRAGGFAGGFFAIWVPGDGGQAMTPVAPDTARRATLQMAALLRAMAAARPDAIRLCTTAAEIETARTAGAVAALMHLEGAEGIGAGLEELDILHAAGLRSLGPVWSRPNIFGHGVPFAHGTSPDTGPGLTEAGRRLVADCARRRILIDLSHITEAGFWDVAALTTGPLIATHSCVHTICPSTRNLTDRQLAAMAERGGLVGLNLAVMFLRPDGRRVEETGLDLVIRHLAYLVERLGEDGVALGSDFDGAPMPAEIGTAAGLPALIGAMRAAGFGDDLIARIAWGNWTRMIGRVIG